MVKIGIWIKGEGQVAVIDIADKYDAEAKCKAIARDGYFWWHDLHEKHGTYLPPAQIQEMSITVEE